MTRRRALALIVSLVVLAGGAGYALRPRRPAVVVEPSADSVTLEVGEVLVIDLGTINSSIGDGWEVAVEPDPTVLTPGESDTEYLADDDEDGGYSTMTYSFEAIAEGETTLELQYSFRGSTADADVLDQVDDPHPRLTVIVE